MWDAVGDVEAVEEQQGPLLAAEHSLGVKHHWRKGPARCTAASSRGLSCRAELWSGHPAPYKTLSRTVASSAACSTLPFLARQRWTRGGSLPPVASSPSSLCALGKPLSSTPFPLAPTFTPTFTRVEVSHVSPLFQPFLTSASAPLLLPSTLCSQDWRFFGTQTSPDSLSSASKGCDRVCTVCSQNTPVSDRSLRCHGVQDRIGTCLA